MTYNVIHPLHHDGKAYGPGDTLELSEAAAAPLLALGVVAPDPAAKPAKPGKGEG